MKIVVIGSFGRSLFNFRGELLRAMANKGHEVLACAPDIPDNVRQRLASFGVDCREIKIRRTGLNPVADLATFWGLVRLLRRERPDRILAYTIKPVIYSSLAARTTGIGEMYSMITGLGYAFADQQGTKSRLVSGIANFLYRQALKSNRCVFFQNPDDLREFQSRGLVAGGADTRLINGSGVDLEHYAPVPLPAGPSFLLIARLIIDKGVREYVAAAKIIRKKYPQAKFFMAGRIDSNPSAITRQELERWRDEGIVTYLGMLQDVRPAIADCLVYVLPSYREGTPRTVLEAMSMGRPVITTDVPGCRETVVHGVNGFLVPARNPLGLTEAMAAFIENPGLADRMGKASRRIAEEKYDVHKVNQVILETMGC